VEEAFCFSFLLSCFFSFLVFPFSFFFGFIFIFFILFFIFYCTPRKSPSRIAEELLTCHLRSASLLDEGKKKGVKVRVCGIGLCICRQSAPGLRVPADKCLGWAADNDERRRARKDKQPFYHLGTGSTVRRGSGKKGGWWTRG